jgi:hypothetical protein
MDTNNGEQVTMAMVMLADALGIDPASMVLAGRTVPEGIELRILIVPEETESDEMAEMRSKVEQAMGEL